MRAHIDTSGPIDRRAIQRIAHADAHELAEESVEDGWDFERFAKAASWEGSTEPHLETAWLRQQAQQCARERLAEREPAVDEAGDEAERKFLLHYAQAFCRAYVSKLRNLPPSRGW